MLTLSLLRHAKSSWDDPTGRDFDRGLAARGTEAAPRMGRTMRGLGLMPDLVLCSPAARTRATLGLVLPELGGPAPEVRYDDRLYLASSADILSLVRGLPAKAGHVLLVGHNPGLHALATELTGKGDAEASQALLDKFPTAALCVLGFEAARWAGVGPRKGTLLHFLTPRRLAAAKS